MTIIHKTETILEVDGDDAASIHRDLCTAIDIVQGVAGNFGQAGIMITQHDYWSFTVAVSHDVPHGQTQEQRRWHSTC